MTDETFGTIVRTVRASRIMANGRPMTTGQLALAAHISPAYVVDMELGRRDPPSPVVVVAIAEALKLPPVTLLHASIRQRGWLELQVPFGSTGTAAMLAEAWPRLDDTGRALLRDAIAKARGLKTDAT